jgi:uncharacterized membrane protein
MCLQRRRPIEKANRNKKLLIFGVLINIALQVVFVKGIELNTEDWAITRVVFLALTSVSFFFALIFFSIATCRDPGFIDKKYDFIDLIDRAIRERVDLNNFCPYDETVKTETYFHC